MGRRIVKLAAAGVGGRAAEVDQGGSGTELGQYWDRLKNLIPAEVSAIYVAGYGVIPAHEKIGLTVWAAACLGFTILFMARETRKLEENQSANRPTDWTHVVISSISFLFWVYALGGPFAEFGIYVPWIGTLLILGWTFVTPYIYKGKTA